MINHVIQARFQNLQHLLARNTAAFERLFVHPPELSFQQPIIVTKPLFLDQPETVIGMFAASIWTMHTGTVSAALQIFCRAEDRQTEPAADANPRTCITSH